MVVKSAEKFKTENCKLKFDGLSFSFSGDHTGGFSTVLENGFRSRLVFVGLFWALELA